PPQSFSSLSPCPEPQPEAMSTPRSRLNPARQDHFLVPAKTPDAYAISDRRTASAAASLPRPRFCLPYGTKSQLWAQMSRAQSSNAPASSSESPSTPSSQPLTREQSPEGSV